MLVVKTTHCYFRKSLSLAPVLNQLNPARVRTLISSTALLILSSHLCLISLAVKLSFVLVQSNDYITFLCVQNYTAETEVETATVTRLSYRTEICYNDIG